MTTPRLTVSDNDALTTLSGLGGLTSVGRSPRLGSRGRLVVEDNPRLATCEPYIGDLLRADAELFESYTDIRGNAFGCRNKWQAIGEQAPLVEGDEERPFASLGANPTTGPLVFQYALDTPTRITLTVHDLLGRHVAEVETGLRDVGQYRIGWSAEGLPPGMYVAVLDLGRDQHTLRFTVLR